MRHGWLPVARALIAAVVAARAAASAVGNQPGTVAALLADGVDPDARDGVPPLNPALFRSTVGNLERDPRFHGHGKRAVEAMHRAGVVGNHGSGLLPPLFTTRRSRLTAVTEVLLEHGASVDIRERLAHGKRGADPLAVATIFGDAAVIDLLLDHGPAPATTPK